MRTVPRRDSEAAIRLLLALFAFIALAVAPLGTQAEARPAGDHCAEIAGMDHHQPTPDHGSPAAVKSCCTAMAAALPDMAGVERAPVLRAAAVAVALSVQHGIRREVEVPPPRT